MTFGLRLRRRPALRAAIILAGFVIIFLGRPLFTGGWYLPADITQVVGTRTVPLDQTLTVKNGLEGDPVTQMDPWWHFDRDEVRAGRLPTWNPYNGLGVPQLANYQAGVFSPYSIPFYVFTYRWALIAAAAAKLWTLAFFFYLLLRRARIGHSASLLGACTYGFGAYHLLWLNWQHVGAAVWLPAGGWAMLFAIQAQTRGRRHVGLALISAVTAASVLAGHPETLLYSGVALAATLVWVIFSCSAEWRRRFLRFWQIAGAVTLGFGVGAIQLLPFREYLRFSAVYASRSASGSGGGLTWTGLPLLAFPNTLGNPASGYSPQPFLLGNFNEANSDYVGLIAVALALAGLGGLFRAGPRRGLAALGASCATAGFLFFHSHAVATALGSVPVFRLATVNRSHDVWIFGISVLAAVGTDMMLDGFSLRDRMHRRRALRLGAVLTVSVGGLALSLHGYHALRQRQVRAQGSAAETPAVVRILHRHLEWIIGSSVLATILVALLVIAPGAAVNARGRLIFGSGVVSGLVALQFALTGGLLLGYNPTVSRTLVYPLTSDYQQSIHFTGNETSLKDSTTMALADSNLWWHTPQLTSYDALGVRWYDSLFTATFGQATAELFDEGTPRCMASLRLFGVRYVWTRNRVPFVAGQGGINSSNVVGPDLANLRPAARFGSITIFAVPGSTGRFSVVPSVSVAATERDALSQVTSCSFDADADADATAVALRVGSGADPRAALSAPAVGARDPAPSQNVRVVSERADRLVLGVAPGPGGELVMRQTWFPGWEAKVDGRSTPIDRVDVAMRGVRVGPGAHVVELAYRPASLREGAALSALSVLGVVLMGGWPYLTRSWTRRKDRQRRAVHEVPESPSL